MVLALKGGQNRAQVVCLRALLEIRIPKRELEEIIMAGANMLCIEQVLASGGMNEGVSLKLKLSLSMVFVEVFLLISSLNECHCSPFIDLGGLLSTDRRVDDFLPEISPNSAPQPLLPLLAPSPLAPFTNNTIPKLSGQCTLNFTASQSLMSKTSIDCWSVFAPLLANVICCPQLEATLAILVGQSSKDTNTLALNGTVSKYCLSDIEQILVGQGAAANVNKICSIHPSNLTEGACPVKDVNEFEGTVDSSKLLASCENIDPVKECCNQVCQNAILEAATKIALKASEVLSIDGSHGLTEQSTKVVDCKQIVLRWLAGKLNPSRAKEVLRGLSNCKVNNGEFEIHVVPLCQLFFQEISLNSEVIMYLLACMQAYNEHQNTASYKSFVVSLVLFALAVQPPLCTRSRILIDGVVGIPSAGLISNYSFLIFLLRFVSVCPLVFPDMRHVAKGCGNGISNKTECCSAMESYVSHLQKQSLITNLQALNCATTLGMKLQRSNITKDVYSLCHITLKDFSLQESGCLLPSLPSDATFDQYSGISFICDLNDNIPAPWPSTSQLSASCNKTIKIPALPAAANAQSGLYNEDVIFYVLFAASSVTMMLMQSFV
ncbi:hypothetical protein DKX38_016751 [Salix brachista]|uniref:Uncharacterized protein n=1 Tax=Salix brachista TaxID=2182728 RepID=A0A5N5KTG5_9ROSI|nr:hypothetical protein DKX38_016751 [Salix brachista]